MWPVVRAPGGLLALLDPFSFSRLSRRRSRRRFLVRFWGDLKPYGNGKYTERLSREPGFCGWPGGRPDTSDTTWVFAMTPDDFRPELGGRRPMLTIHVTGPSGPSATNADAGQNTANCGENPRFFIQPIRHCVASRWTLDRRENVCKFLRPLESRATTASRMGCRSATARAMPDGRRLGKRIVNRRGAMAHAA